VATTSKHEAFSRNYREDVANGFLVIHNGHRHNRVGKFGTADRLGARFLSGRVFRRQRHLLFKRPGPRQQIAPAPPNRPVSFNGDEHCFWRSGTGRGIRFLAQFAQDRQACHIDQARLEVGWRWGVSDS
jgi:hypothetical protein